MGKDTIIFETKKMASQAINPNLTGLNHTSLDENRTDQMAGLVAELPSEHLTTNEGLIIGDNQNSLKRVRVAPLC